MSGIRGLGLLGLLSLSALVFGCEESTHTLVVDLQTDLVPNLEFESVETKLDDGPPILRPANAGAAYAIGALAAAFDSIEEGDHLVTVSLLDASGEVAVERKLAVRLSTNSNITATIARSCLNVRCGDLTCVAGECVSPDCVRGDEASCPEPECESDSACAIDSPCATGACVSGTCLFADLTSSCGGQTVCLPEEGCVSASLEAAPTCDDGEMNGSEEGVDCGGDCDACEAAPTCDDGEMNGSEEGVDCGGDCDACEAAPTCDDGEMNGSEEGVDCGGDCDACEVAPTCDDGEMNGSEEGVDCGGDCDACEAAPTCDDGEMNGSEEGVDCGGDCDACEAAPTCDDGEMNGSEEGVDCGGDCAPCADPTFCDDIASGALSCESFETSPTCSGDPEVCTWASGLEATAPNAAGDSPMLFRGSGSLHATWDGSEGTVLEQEFPPVSAEDLYVRFYLLLESDSTSATFFRVGPPGVTGLAGGAGGTMGMSGGRWAGRFGGLGFGVIPTSSGSWLCMQAQVSHGTGELIFSFNGGRQRVGGNTMISGGWGHVSLGLLGTAGTPLSAHFDELAVSTSPLPCD